MIKLIPTYSKCLIFLVYAVIVSPENRKLSIYETALRERALMGAASRFVFHEWGFAVPQIGRELGVRTFFCFQKICEMK